jgi:hypothetical protein
MISGTGVPAGGRGPGRGRDLASCAGQARISHRVKAAGPVVVTTQLSRCLMAISAEIVGYMAISPNFWTWSDYSYGHAC